MVGMEFANNKFVNVKVIVLEQNQWEEDMYSSLYVRPASLFTKEVIKLQKGRYQIDYEHTDTGNNKRNGNFVND